MIALLEIAIASMQLVHKAQNELDIAEPILRLGSAQPRRSATIFPVPAGIISLSSPLRFEDSATNKLAPTGHIE